MKKTIFFLMLFLPILVLADRGMVVWPEQVNLDQTAQNAIVAWNNNQEMLILSVDLKSSEKATSLGVFPLPSSPSSIEEGSFESFEVLAEIINEKLERGDWDYESGTLKSLELGGQGVEITFQDQIGAHDITVVKVNDLDYFLEWIKEFSSEKGFSEKEVSDSFKQGIKNYLKKDIKYFVFDVIETGEDKESVNPLIYTFESDYLYYPMLISGISEIEDSYVEINLFLISKENIPGVEYNVSLTEEELKQVSLEIADMFESDVKVGRITLIDSLRNIDYDLMVFPSYIWQNNLSQGSQGEQVKALQQVLINQNFWDSDAGATGYFGPVTQKALIKFQEEYSWEILNPAGLDHGTGYFGPSTKDYLKSNSLKTEKLASFSRNLSLGMSGEDVKLLQETLIQEGVWNSDAGATGYFGFITKQAVIKYQEKYASDILEPLGLSQGTGFVGPSTIAHLNKD